MQRSHQFRQSLGAQLAALEQRFPARPLPPEARVVRAAPAPTGWPHIGTAMQAVINYALAQQTGGRFLLRIEDSDRKRLVPGATEAILEALAWLQLLPDEGPGLPGAYGPYVASERLDIYQVVAQRLVEQGAAYPCFCSSTRLDHLRAEQQAAGHPPGYDRHCRFLTTAQRQAHLAAGEPAVIRLAMPLEGTITFPDPIRGLITFAAEGQDDPVLLKTDGYPTYHLAAPVDDHFMGVTLVVRGEEWIPSVPKYLVLYQALGWTLPTIVHTPLLRDPKRRKLSKSGGDTSLRWFRTQGYLPEAIRNWITRLIWVHPAGKDVYPLSDFIQAITPQGLPKTGPVADLKLLEFLSGAYMRQLDAPTLYETTCRWLEWLQSQGSEAITIDVLGKQERTSITISARDLEVFQLAFTANRALSEQILTLEPERYRKLGDILLSTRFFYPELFMPPSASQLLKPVNGARSVAVAALRAYLAAFQSAWSEPEWQQAVSALADSQAVKPGAVFMLLRVAVTGTDQTPPLYPILHLLGEGEIRRRLEAALTALA